LTSIFVKNKKNIVKVVEDKILVAHLFKPFRLSLLR